MRILITGANGFLGRNLCFRLKELGSIELLKITRESSDYDLLTAINKADFIFHLAGVNRPENPEDFQKSNSVFTQHICSLLTMYQRPLPIVYTSSAQALMRNPYGVSKREAEDILHLYSKESGAKVFIYRLPNIFGKWCKPNYNSVVATFCHNVANNLPIKIDDPATELKLAYVDDVVDSFINLIGQGSPSDGFQEISPIYTTSVGNLAAQIKVFNDSRTTMITERVGTGFLRALYSTYISYLPPNKFSYEITKHCDSRGEFVEVLKTHDSGQFSFFTAHSGVTRGGHYHHSKTEKFLVIRGRALFRFRNIISDDRYEILIDGERSEIVETAPGWTHDITNVGDKELIVMLWSNENFNPQAPDTITNKV